MCRNLLYTCDQENDTIERIKRIDIFMRLLYSGCKEIRSMNSNYNRDNKVVQANQFIQQTNWSLKETQLKLLKVFISCIDTKNPSDTIHIRKLDLVDVLGESYRGHYNDLKEHIKELYYTSLKFVDEKKETNIHLIRKFEWYKDSELITIKFENELMPYLIDLNERFLQYDVYNIKGFKSKYGLIMYEYLLSRERQERNKDHEYFISLNDLKRLTGTMDKYKDNRNFFQFIVKASEKDINNARVEFLMRYEKIRTGRQVVGVKFILRKRTSYTETEFDGIKNKSYSKQKI